MTHNFDCPIKVADYDPNGPTTRNLRTETAALAYYDNAMRGTSIILIVSSPSKLDVGPSPQFTVNHAATAE